MGIDGGTRWDGSADFGVSTSDSASAWSDGGAFYDSSIPYDSGVLAPPDMPVEPPPEEEPDAGIDVCAHRASLEPYTLYMSADDSNSMASPAIARRDILQHRRPIPDYLRTYEFLNYYNVAYPLPASNHVRVVPELREGETAGEYVMQIGVQGPVSDIIAAKPRVFTLILDTSGSMAGDPILREQHVVRAIAAHLRAGDIVSEVEWNTDHAARLRGHVVTGPNDPALIALAEGLRADGGTDLNAGLRFGYEVAHEFYDPAKLNRVVVVSDGQANAGVTEINIIDDASEDAEADGIFLVGVGVGNGYDDSVMDAVTDAGRGAYIFIDSTPEAYTMFGPRFDEVMHVGMMNVRLEVTLPWYMAVTEFHGEEISTVASEVKPQHLAPNDAMVFHQVLTACDPSAVSLADAVTARATYVVPTGRVPGSDSVSTTLGELLSAADRKSVV